MAWVYSDELKAKTGNGWSDEPEPQTSRLAIPEKLSPNSSPRGAAPVRLIILHTAEGARTVQELGNYFAKVSVQVSSHVGIDDHGLEQYVPYEREAWTTRNANPISDNAELCGFAKWTRDQWLNEHRPMLEIAASWVAARCAARNIPIVKLSPAEVAAGKAGVCGHVDWTVGMKDGSHTDPGPGFPWDVVISLAQGGKVGGGVVAQDVNGQIDDMHHELTDAWPAWGGGVTDGQGSPYRLAQFVLRNNVEIHQCALMLQKLAQQRQVQLHDATVERIVEGVHERTADVVADITHRAVVDELATSGFWASALERMAKTFAGSLLTLLGAGPLDVLHIPWESTLSLAAGSALVSLLMSLASSQTGTKGSPSLVRGGE